ncbi:MAG TPA: hypothetical protein VFE50_03485, partial [Cyclobacteriaceae bacterium]|nr:hypothetical protein [Cyclobacteriaceae bacterium]
QANIKPRMELALPTSAAVEQSVTAASINEAKRIFKEATNRLLNIGEWNRGCSGLSAIFKLADQTGRIVNRKARPHDLVKVDEDNTVEVSRLITIRKPSGKAESLAVEMNGSTEFFELKRYNNVVTAVVRQPLFISSLEWSRILSFILWIK